MAGAIKGTEFGCSRFDRGRRDDLLFLGVQRGQEETEAPFRKIAPYGRAQREKVALERPGLIPVIGRVHHLTGAPVAVTGMKMTAFARRARGGRACLLCGHATSPRRET